MNDKGILHVFSSKKWGGGEVYVLNIVNKLLNDNFNVVLVSQPSEIIKSKLYNINVDYYQLKLRGIFDIFSAVKLKKIVLNNNIKIIHVHNFKTAFTAVYTKLLLKNRVRVVLTRHLVRKAKISYIYNFLYKNIDTLVFVSNIVKKEFFSSNPKIDKNKCLVLFNSIENYNNITNKKENIRLKYNIAKNTPIILYCGRLDAEKGIEILIDAVDKIKEQNFVLLVAGDGSKQYKQYLQQKIDDDNLNNNVKLIGFVDDIYPLIEECDFGVCPTLVKEAFGLSVLQFMQMGKSVITTNNGAQPEFISNMNNGILINPNDSVELSQRMQLLLKDKKLKQFIGSNAKEYFDNNLNYDLFYKKLTCIYYKLYM